MNDTRITQYAIYDHPPDHPDGYVVREWYVSAEGAEPGPARTVDTLDEAHALLPEGVTKVEDHGTPGEPQLIEVWL
jgi:hypothetical protein